MMSVSPRPGGGDKLWGTTTWLWGTIALHVAAACACVSSSVNLNKRYEVEHVFAFVLHAPSGLNFRVDDLL